MTAAQGGHSI